MGLLARASKEAPAARPQTGTGQPEGPEKALFPGAGSPAEGRGLPVPDREALRAWASEFPHKYDVLGILVERPPKAASTGGSDRPLIDGLRRAIGPSCELFSAPSGILALGIFRGDWDPEIYERQLRHSLGQSIVEALAIRIGRLSRDRPDASLEDQVARFAGI